MDSSSPSTCLSLSSSDLFASPSNSSLASWPSSPTSSKRTAPAPTAAAAAARFSTSPSKRRHGGQLDQHRDVDCTLSLGNAATRKSEDAPSRLSRAGSPVEDRGGGAHGGGTQQFHWLRAQQQCDLAGEAATRNLASLRSLQQVDASAAAQPSSYQSILAAQNSHFPPYIPSTTSSTRLGGLLDSFSPTHHCSSSNTLSGFLDLNTKLTNVESTRPRFHNDPRNVPRVCAHCGTTSTPLWRNGPHGPKSLCNACGIRFKKIERRSPTTTAASTPPVSWSMQVPAASFHQDTFGMRSSSSEGIPPPMASPLVVQRDKRDCIPFAREWSESTSSSNYAVGSSCITWQDSNNSLPTSFDSSNMRRVVSNSSRRLSSPPAAVLEAEVIRSSDDRRRAEQGSFLKIAL